MIIQYMIMNSSLPFPRKTPIKQEKTGILDEYRFSLFWRSRRDLNPRYPFGVHTISSRARYDHFDTAPYLCRPQTALI